MDGAPWGGSEELWGGTALSLAGKAAWTVCINVARWPEAPKMISQLAAAGASVTRRTRRNTLSQKAARRVLGETAYKWLDTQRPDFAVISQGGNTDGVDWMLECARRGIPYACIAQMANDGHWMPYETMKQNAAAYSQAKACFFVSQANLELTERQIACRLPQASVVRNPFHVSYDANPTWPAEDETFKLACVGRLTPNAKGQDLILDVFSQEKWRQRPIEVTLYGSGPCRESIAALAEMLDVTVVRFGGFESHIENIWATHHALILPSRFEGLPLSVVEAMLCGRVCIVTDIAGNAELLTDNETGFVAAAPSARSLDEALERAWQKRTEWKLMGQAAREQVRSLVPTDPIAQFVKALSEVISHTLGKQL